MKRIIAIGDIHGCDRELEVLLDAIEPGADDLIVPLGDVIDRGPDSPDVIERLMQLDRHCELLPILGNHEEMMLSVLEGASPDEWIFNGGVATLEAYGFAGDFAVIPETHREFLESFRDFVETDSHFFVHANYESRLSLHDQRGKVLRWMSLRAKVPRMHASGRHCVVGHTANERGEIYRYPHLTGIDTYCYGGGWLTAYDVNSGQVWQARRDGDYRAFLLEERSTGFVSWRQSRAA